MTYPTNHPTRLHERDFLVIDLEATCDDGKLVPRNVMEIIEIGAVRVDGETFEVLDEFQTFIRPLRRPTLTPFCTKLTSITQAQVDTAPTFPHAIEQLREFIRAGKPVLFGSWGAYDRGQFEQDAQYHRVELPFGREHLNIKQAFSDTLGTSKRFGMAGALRELGLPLIGTHHRGIDDARNIARILPFAIGALPLAAAAAMRTPQRRRA